MPENILTGTMLEAAQYVADARLSQDEIAAKVGIVRSTLWLWRKLPEFIAEVARATEERRQEIRRLGIADPENRLSALNDRHVRLRRIMEARADSEEMQGIPGGNTGLIVRTQKMIGSGQSATVVEEYSIDVGLLRELREHEKQAAIEMGQWAAEKGDATSGSKPQPIQFVKLVRTIPAGITAPADAEVGLTTDPSLA